jgi:hypothetical protein
MSTDKQRILLHIFSSKSKSAMSVRSAQPAGKRLHIFDNPPCCPRAGVGRPCRTWDPVPIQPLHNMLSITKKTFHDLNPSTIRNWRFRRQFDVQPTTYEMERLLKANLVLSGWVWKGDRVALPYPPTYALRWNKSAIVNMMKA